MHLTNYAGFWRRAAALVVDGVLLFTLMLFGLVTWIAISGEAHSWDSAMMAWAFYSSLLAALLLKIVLDAKCQGTPGLHLLDCRLLDARSGCNISLGQSLLRCLAIPVSVLPLLLGLIWILWDRRKQAWHDKLVHSVVIREDDALKSLAELAGESW
ncbi:MAG: RDD family protein [Pseudomonadota bacterium]